MVDSQNQIYPNVFVLGMDIPAVGISIPILAAPFKTVKFTVYNETGVDVSITAYESNQELPPDISQPVSYSNQYAPVGYTDDSDGSYYDTANPFPVPTGTVSIFNIESTGARWYILSSDVTEPLPTVDVSTFSNFK